MIPQFVDIVDIVGGSVFELKLAFELAFELAKCRLKHANDDGIVMRTTFGRRVMTTGADDEDDDDDDAQRLSILID